jgi:phenylacetate-CoA ligase
MAMYRQLYQLMRMIRPREFLSRKYLRELEQNQWLSQDELRHLEWQKLKQLLDHAYANVPFYHERFTQVGLTPADIQTRADFCRVPLLSKDDIRTHVDDLIAQNYPKSRMRRDSTSGSTGIPLVVYHDHHSVPLDNAAFTRSRRWFGVEPGDKAAWIWGRKDDLPADVWSARLITALKRERWFNAFRVSDEEMQGFAQMLAEWQPDYLVGYATSIYHFARYVSSHHISKIHFKAVETTAGTLFPYQRQVIEETFGCKVFDRYGSHEVGHIAAECEHGRMHIFCDVAYVEVLSNGKPTSKKEIGEIVVTPLYNYGMPLIRFRIGDAGILDTRACPCGRGLPILRELVGRTNSIITLPSGKYLYGGIFLTILEDILEIQQFRVYQPARDKLEILLEKGDGFSQETIGLVRRRAIKLLADESVEVSILATDEILPTANGKYLVTTSDVPIDF